MFNDILFVCFVILDDNSREIVYQGQSYKTAKTLASTHEGYPAFIRSAHLLIVEDDEVQDHIVVFDYDNRKYSITDPRL